MKTDDCGANAVARIVRDLKLMELELCEVLRRNGVRDLVVDCSVDASKKACYQNSTETKGSFVMWERWPQIGSTAITQSPFKNYD